MFTLSEALSEFLLDCEARRLSARTVGYYAWQLGRFVAWLAGRGVTAVEGVTRGQARAYLAGLEAAGWRDRSAHAAGRALRVWGKFLVAEGHAGASFMQGVKLVRVARDILPALSEADMDRLLAETAAGAQTRAAELRAQGYVPQALQALAGAVRDRAVLLCLLDSGCRAAEFVGLNISDIEAGGRVFVKAGKGRKDRFVRLDVDARAALAEYLAQRAEAGPDAAVWVSETTGQRLTVIGLQQLLRRLGTRAGVGHCHPHSLRRSCALFMKRRGASELEIALYLGHSDLSTVRRYLALDDSDIGRIHASYGAVGRLTEAAQPVSPARPRLRVLAGGRG